MHVEPGHRLDPSAAFADPRDPNDRPLAQHLVREVGPALASAQGSSAWLVGIDDLVDRGQAGAFVASRLAYRRLLRRSGWLIIPALVGLALFWSFFELTGRRTSGSALLRVIRLLGGGLALEVAVVAVVLVFTVTQLHNALGGVDVVGFAVTRQRRRARRGGDPRVGGRRRARHRAHAGAPS